MQLGYKQTFCKNVGSTKKLLLITFHENVTCLNVDLLRICQVFSVSCKLCIGELGQIAVS